MNRRDFISLSAAATLAAAPRIGAGQTPTMHVQIGPRTLPTIPDGFMGLGYEISSVARPGLLSAANGVYVQLARQLGAQGVIRVGGNTADYAHYNAHGPVVSSPKGTLVNAAALSELGTFLRKTGWQLIWALNLGSATEAEAVAEAEMVTRAAGDQLLAFEIGNEPDLFAHEKHRPPEYNYEDWLADYRRYKNALRARLPKIRFAGPDVAGKTDWVTRFAADEGRDVVLLTHHYYREGQNPGSTIEKLLGPDPKLQPQLTALRTASEQSGVPYRICEVNSFSGGGRPGVSDTMAGALWTLDYCFTLALNGCAGVNMETGVNQLGFISSYSPIGYDEHGTYHATPEYYGLLAFAQAGQGALHEVDLTNEQPLLRAYAASSTASPLRVTLINKSSVSSQVSVSTGGSEEGSAQVLRLAANQVSATTGITLGGAEVSRDGHWQASQHEALPLHKGLIDVPLPAYSAALLTLHRG